VTTPVICHVAPIIRKRYRTPICQGEVLSTLLGREGYRVETAPDAMEWPDKLREVEAAFADVEFGPNLALVEVYTGESRLALAEYAAERARARGCKLVLILIGGAIPDFLLHQTARARRLLGQADAIVSSSEYIARAVRALALPTCVVPHTVCLADYPFAQRMAVRPHLLWMRAFEDTYNPQMAVDVLAHLRARGRDVHMTMAGMDDGGLADTRRHAEARGLTGAIEFLSFLENGEKQRRMLDADLYLNTNRSDNLPVSVMEAGAMGMPVVATNVGGLAEIVEHGRNGYLVPSEDAGAMADAVERLLVDSELTARLSAEARVLAARFDWSRVYPAWRQLLAGVLEGQRCSS
jgi:hypothetical protein